MSRKASGESTIYRDAAGRWHGYVSMGLKDNGGVTVAVSQARSART
ncbi:MAG: hypothetical protein M3P48_04825 [Actinomycetota bacterium]|nr:hypothetical protein [Actinomycetota bacterium]